MKVTRENDDFKPITVVIESRDEALRLAAAVLGGLGSDDTRLLARFGHTNVGAMGAPLTFSREICQALGVPPMGRN